MFVTLNTSSKRAFDGLWKVFRKFWRLTVLCRIFCRTILVSKCVSFGGTVGPSTCCLFWGLWLVWLVSVCVRVCALWSNWRLKGATAIHSNRNARGHDRLISNVGNYVNHISFPLANFIAPEWLEMKVSYLISNSFAIHFFLILHFYHMDFLLVFD